MPTTLNNVNCRIILLNQHATIRQLTKQFKRPEGKIIKHPINAIHTFYVIIQKKSITLDFSI